MMYRISYLFVVLTHYLAYNPEYEAATGVAMKNNYYGYRVSKTTDFE